MTKGEQVKITELEMEIRHIKEDVGRLTETVEDGFEKLSAEMQKTYVRKDNYRKDMKQILRETQKNTKDKNWIVQVIINAVIMAVMGVIMIKS